MSRPKNQFANAYREISATDPRRHSSWFRHMREMDESLYSYLHAAQLLKHYFGLAQLDRSAGTAGTAVTLLYLYWVPSNWPEVTIAGDPGSPVNPFAEYMREIERFGTAVPDDQATGITFAKMSTLELFGQWGKLEQRDDIKEHVGLLRARYDVAIQAIA